jgi:hypothetical protein
VLDLSRVRGALVATVRARAPWRLELPQSTGASFHAVTAGPHGFASRERNRCN